MIVVPQWVCDCDVTVGIYVYVWFQSGYVIVVSQWVYMCLCVSKWVCDCGVTVGMCLCGVKVCVVY